MRLACWWLVRISGNVSMVLLHGDNKYQLHMYTQNAKLAVTAMIRKIVTNALMNCSRSFSTAASVRAPLSSWAPLQLDPPDRGNVELESRYYA